jgi:hypothetical protein
MYLLAKYLGVAMDQQIVLFSPINLASASPRRVESGGYGIG